MTAATTPGARMTEATNPQPEQCPGCQHPQHQPGTECEAAIDHGPKRWHRCLCLNRPNATRPCSPLMDCQGGELGYGDIWYLQQGRSLQSANGIITPDVLTEPPAAPVPPSAPTDRATEWRAAADRLEAHAATVADVSDDPAIFVAKARIHDAEVWREAAALLRRMAVEAPAPNRAGDEAQQGIPWLSDSARIGRTLIWTWSEIGKGSYGQGYRAAQSEARALLTGKRDNGEVQQTESEERSGCAHKGPHPGFTCAEVDQTRPFWEGRWGELNEEPAAASQPTKEA